MLQPSLVPEQIWQGNGRKRALLVLINNNLCCSPPRKGGDQTHFKCGPFPVALEALLFQYLVAFVPLPLPLYRNE